MIAREQSLDPGYSLNLSARADALTKKERNEILAVRMSCMSVMLLCEDVTNALF